MVEPNGAMLTSQKVADMLGVRQGTVNRWCRDGTIPAIQIGRSWRLDKAEVQNWLASKRPQPRPHGVQDGREEEMLAAKEAGAILGVSDRTVQRYADDLAGRKIKGRWLFPRYMVERAREEGLPLTTLDEPSKMWRGPGEVVIHGLRVVQDPILPLRGDNQLAVATRGREMAEERLWSFYQRVARAMGVSILEMCAELNIEEALLERIRVQTQMLQNAIDTERKSAVQ